MKNAATVLLAFSLLVFSATLAMRPAQAQTTSSSVLVFPAVALSSCAWPAELATPIPSGYIALCNTTTGLATAVSPSTTFTLIGGSSGVLPQSVTAASGTCLTGYSSTTGAFTAGPCIASLTKAAVLATGIAATTTLQ